MSEVRRRTSVLNNLDVRKGELLDLGMVTAVLPVYLKGERKFENEEKKEN